MNDKEKQKLFDEITEHLLEDTNPSKYIASLSAEKVYSVYPFTMLWELKTTEQSAKYHPEGSVWNHTLLVLDEAAGVRRRTKDTAVFMWAALLHDIGKPETTKIRKQKITSYDHDKAGEKLCIEFLSYLIDDQTFIKKVAALVRYHMHMLYVLKQLPYADMQGLISRVDAEDIALLCRCDRLGRSGADPAAEEYNYTRFLDSLKSRNQLCV